jgi:hypothetical protein
MANNLIQIKRTSVSGRAANTVTLPNAGELALNMADGIMYSTNGTTVFEIGANNTNVNVTNTLTVATISANGSNGSAGQVLTSNGTKTYWSTISAASGANADAQYVWTNTHNFQANVTFGSSSPSKNIAVTAYTTKFTVYSDSSQAPNGGLYSSYGLELSSGPITLNDSPGTNGQVITSNGSVATWQNLPPASVNVAAQYTWTNTQTFSNTITFTQTINGTANNATYAYGKLESALNVNSALTSNNTTYAYGKTENNLNVNSALTSNNSTYAFGKSESDLNVNSSLTSNNSTYAFGKSESGLNVNSALTANDSTNLGGVAAASYVNTSGAYTLSGNLTFNGNLIIGTSAGINANGGYGTAGQVLTSNGTTLYWSTVASGGGSTNVDAQYTWTNTHTFTNTVALNAVSANGSLGTSGQVLTSNGSDTYWSTVSASGNSAVSGVSETFTANGTGNTFVLSSTVSNIADIVVSLNGLIQTPTTHYTLSSNTVTFTTNPPNNSIVEVRSFTGGSTSSLGSLPTMQVFTYTAPAGTWARGASQTGTTTRSGTTVTATVNGHGYSVGDLLYLDATTGTIADQWVEVATTPTTNTFTCIIDSASGSGGNATFYPPVVITANGHGLANSAYVYINFAQTFADTFYLVYQANSSTFQVEASSVTSGLSNTGSVTLDSFNSSQTWTKPAGCRSVSVKVVGGGGSTTNSPTASYSAAIAGGGYAEEIIDVSAVSNVTVTIGKGGIITSNASLSQSFRDGGTSSFGSYLSATGSSNNTPGDGVSGSLNIKGTKGTYAGGDLIGGISPMGGGTYGLGTYGTNVSCCGWIVLANGSPGVVIVTEYY